MSIDMYEIWRRAETGPICPTRHFETRVLFPKIQELRKKYEIAYEPEAVVTTDDGLIDRTYEAAVELLVEVGVLCTDTEKLIKFTREEIEDTIRFAPSEVTVGEGREAVSVRHREIEDRRPPLICGGPIAAPISEDVALTVYEAYGREPSVESLWPGTQTMCGGMEVRPSSALEMHAEKETVAAAREGFRRAGRPGIAIWGSCATSPEAAIGACHPRYYRQCDIIHCWLVVNMKTNYDTLCRAEHYQDYGCHFYGSGTSFVGGILGGAEGAAIGSVAETLASYILFRGDLTTLWTPDVMYSPGMTARKPVWAGSLGQAAMARHTHIVVGGWTPYQAYAGPCTDMYLYEVAACVIAHVVSGCCMASHGGGRQGNQTDYFGGPLDSRFVRDVAHAATKLDRPAANTVVKALLGKYEDRIAAKDPPLGKSFQECNDLDTLQPTDEYVELYETVKEDLGTLGLEFA